MRKALYGLAGAVGLIAALFAATDKVGSEEPYPWCAAYSGPSNGATNCGFVTIEQCRATISGVGGYCQQNPWYPGPANKSAQRSRKLYQY